jgi:hypothetical protein
MAGTANQNYAVRWTLAEANTMRRAAERQRDVLLAEFHSMSPDGPVAEAELREELGAEIGRLETILRRDL